MINIFYTTREGRRNRNGHTITRGNVYLIVRGGDIEPDELRNIGEYTHQSGGAGIELAILTIAAKAGINTNGGYYGGKWRNVINLIEL